MPNTSLIQSPWSNPITVTSGFIVSSTTERIDLKKLPIENKSHFQTNILTVDNSLFHIYENVNGKITINKYQHLTDIEELFFETDLTFNDSFICCEGNDKIFLFLSASSYASYEIYQFTISTKTLTLLDTSAITNFIYDPTIKLIPKFYNNQLFLYFTVNSIGNSNFIKYDINSKVVSIFNPNGNPFPNLTTGKTTIIGTNLYLIEDTNTPKLWKFNLDVFDSSWVNLGTFTLLSSDYSVKEIFTYEGKLLFLIAQKIILNGVEEFNYSFMTRELNVDSPLVAITNPPGLTDLSEPTFGILSDYVYVMGNILNKIYPHEIVSSRLDILPVENLIGASRSCFFTHNNQFGHVAVKRDPITTRETDYYLQLTSADGSTKSITKLNFNMENPPSDMNKCYHNGKLYFHGGSYNDPDQGGLTVPAKFLFEVDPNTGNGILIDETGLAGRSSAFFGYNNKLYCIGGYVTDPNICKAFRCFDLTTKVWTDLSTNDLLKRYDDSYFAINNNTIILHGGSSNSITPAQMLLPISISLTDYSVIVLPALPTELIYPRLVFHDNNILAMHSELINDQFKIYKYNTVNNLFELFKSYPKTVDMNFTTVTTTDILSYGDKVYIYGSTNGDDPVLIWEDCILGFPMTSEVINVVIYNYMSNKLSVNIKTPFTNIGEKAPIEGLMEITAADNSKVLIPCESFIQIDYEEGACVYTLSVTDFPKDSVIFNNKDTAPQDPIMIRLKVRCENTAWSDFSESFQVTNNISYEEGGA